MASNLERLASRLHCPRDRCAVWRIAADNLTCTQCGTTYACENGVLVMAAADEDPEISREREAALRTEHDPALGGINDAFDDLARAEGPLKDAVLALPYGDGSRYYEEQGYFRNVRASVRAFEFILQHLQPRPGERLLDLGADFTWSTSHFARRGLDCTAVDINHHLAVAQLFERQYGVSYDLVRSDMATLPFNDGTFHVIVGIDALHHSNHLDALARNIARMLAPGGRLALVEPYSHTEEDKQRFGRAQIEAGINEHVYLLEEWHAAFTRAGLVVRNHRILESFAAVYQKPRSGTATAAAGGEGGQTAIRDSLFEGFGHGRLTVLLEPPALVRPRETINVRLRVENLSRHSWNTESLLVRASYHLYKTNAASGAGAAGSTARGELLSWDNPRTALPGEIPSGDAVTMTLEITAPDTPGDYLAEIDLLHEFVSWFAPGGVESRWVSFRVVAP